jgi:hypothetical protein
VGQYCKAAGMLKVKEAAWTAFATVAAAAFVAQTKSHPYKHKVANNL